MPRVPKVARATILPGAVVTEPMRSIVDGLCAMTLVVHENTMKGKILTLVVNAHLGIRLGILSGQAAKIMTAAGPVEIYCEFD